MLNTSISFKKQQLTWYVNQIEPQNLYFTRFQNHKLTFYLG